MNIGLAGWAINGRFRTKENPLKMEEFPRVAKEEFGIDRVELNSPFLASREDGHLKAIVRAASVSAPRGMLPYTLCGRKAIRPFWTHSRGTCR